jgi:hypothetical protein
VDIGTERPGEGFRSNQRKRRNKQSQPVLICISSTCTAYSSTSNNQVPLKRRHKSTKLCCVTFQQTVETTIHTRRHCPEKLQSYFTCTISRFSYKAKGKFVSVCAMNVYRGSRDKDSLSTRRSPVVSVTPWPLYSRERNPVPIK